MNLPNGPNINAYRQAMRNLRNPPQFLCDNFAKYGDWFTLRFPKQVPFVLTADVTAINTLFKASHTQLAAGVAIHDFYAPFLGQCSLFVLDGEDHLKQRRALMPAFQGQTVKSYLPSIQAACQRVFNSLNIAQPQKLVDIFQAITLQTFLTSIFGIRDAQQFQQATVLTQRYLQTLLNPWLLLQTQIPLLRLPATAWSRMQQAAQNLRQFLRAIIIERRHQDASIDDTIQYLLNYRDEQQQALNDEAIIDQLLTVLIAGFDTTALSLAWAVFDLISHPSIYQQVRQEIQQVINNTSVTLEQLEQLPMTTASLQESMRLHPVSPFLLRRVIKPMSINGVDLPAGVNVCPTIYLLHRHPAHWQQPNAYDITRFLDNTYPKHAFIPFGGGIRRCLGHSLAFFQMKIIMSEFLHRFDVTLKAGYCSSTITHGVLYAPSDGVPINLAS